MFIYLLQKVTTAYIPGPTIDKQGTYQGHSVNAKCQHPRKEKRRQACIELITLGQINGIIEI